MSNIAIRIDRLGKRYKIGVKRERYYTLRDSLMNALTYPFRRRRPAPADNPHPQADFIWALKDVSLEINHGDILGIIGRNGAGKSTLLKILSRITEPTEGQAEIFGRVGSLLEVGTGFHPELTGRENIFLNGVIMGMTKAEVQHNFDEIVAFAEIEKFLDTPVKHFSSGMYVRLAFAVAAHLDPEILLVDEVLAVGDAAFQKKCLGKMEDVAKGGRTVLFVSHNMGAMRALCQKGILLESGSLMDINDIDSVVEKYNSQFTNIIDINLKEYNRPLKNCTKRVLIRDCNVSIPLNWNDSFILYFKYEVMTKVRYFSLDWFLKDSFGTRIMSGFSALSDNNLFIPSNNNVGEIKSIVKEWRLPGGRYSITVQIQDPLIEQMDYVEDIIFFDIPNMYLLKQFQFTPKFGYNVPYITWNTDSETKIINP
jgi:lipopolysaccharide transport system ATP-binding protein